MSNSHRSNYVFEQQKDENSWLKLHFHTYDDYLDRELNRSDSLSPKALANLNEDSNPVTP